MRASRSISSRSEASSAGVGSATPSSSASWPACRIAIGVRSSCARSATRSRRICSCRSSVSGHLVEGGRQFAQLAGGADLADPGGAVPVRHGPGHRDQPRHRAGDPPGHRKPGQQREQCGQPGRPGDGPQQRGQQHAVGGAEAGTGGPGQDHADPLAPDHDRGAGLRCRSAPRSRARRRWYGRPGRGSGRPRRSSRPGPGPGKGRHLPSCSARSQAAPAATAIALVSSVCCRVASAETSAAANAAVSPASSATAASATARNASASRRPSVSPRARRPAARRISHRGPGPAGSRRPARSGRSGDRPDRPRSCGAGSSRASRRCAHSLRTHTPAPG